MLPSIGSNWTIEHSAAGIAHSSERRITCQGERPRPGAPAGPFSGPRSSGCVARAPRKPLRRDGFQEVSVKPCFECEPVISRLALSRHRPQARCTPRAAYTSGDLVAVDVWQPDVQQDQVRAEGLCWGDGAPAACHAQHSVRLSRLGTTPIVDDSRLYFGRAAHCALYGLRLNPEGAPPRRAAQVRACEMSNPVASMFRRNWPNHRVVVLNTVASPATARMMPASS
jgi:hypothetical protein